MAFNVTPNTAVSEAAMFHGACAYKDTAQSIPASTFTDIEWDQVAYDTDNFLNLGSSVTNFVIPQGVEAVKIHISIFMAGTAANVIYQIRALLNGSNFTPRFQERIQAVTSSYTPMFSKSSDVIFVTGGDILKGQVQHNHSVPVNLQGSDVVAMSVEVVKTPIGRPS